MHPWTSGPGNEPYSQQRHPKEFSIPLQFAWQRYWQQYAGVGYGQSIFHADLAMHSNALVLALKLFLATVWFFQSLSLRTQ